MHNDCSYGYKVTCCYDHKFSKTVQNYRDGKTVYTFIKKKKKCLKRFIIVKKL